MCGNQCRSIVCPSQSRTWCGRTPPQRPSFCVDMRSRHAVPPLTFVGAANQSGSSLEDLVKCSAQIFAFHSSCTGPSPILPFVPYMSLAKHKQGRNLGLLQEELTSMASYILCACRIHVYLFRSWCRRAPVPHHVSAATDMSVLILPKDVRVRFDRRRRRLCLVSSPDSFAGSLAPIRSPYERLVYVGPYARSSG